MHTFKDKNNNGWPGEEATLEKTFAKSNGIGETKLYYFDVDFSSYSHIIFVRVDKNNNATSQTNNIELATLTTTNMVVLKNAYYLSNEGDQKVTTVNNTYDSSKTNPDYGQFRIYFKDQSWWNKDGATTSVFSHESSDLAGWPGKYMHKITINSTNYWYYDFDIGLADISFCRMDKNGYSAGATASSSKDWGAETIRISAQSLGYKNLITLSSNQAWKNDGNRAQVSYSTL